MLHPRTLWLNVRASLWFVPSLCVGVAIALAIGLTALDTRVGRDWFAGHSLLFGVGVDGARGMLTAIAGSMMTVASLSFSLTISTLATASAQYGSRLIGNFMRDRFNQFVLGYFVGLFAYCLIVLRAIRGGDEGQFVPSFAVFAGLLLAIASIAVLILFIHHIATSIQASSILGNATRQTIAALRASFPKDVGEPADDADDAVDERSGDPADALDVAAGRLGYVQAIDGDALVAIAAAHDATIRLSVDPGTFVTPRGALCTIHRTRAAAPARAHDDADADGAGDDALAARVRAAIAVGPSRTIEQDPAFGVRQVVDVCLRALSAGINDPTTAVMSLEYLGAILEVAVRQQMPARRRAADGVVRLVAHTHPFTTLVSLAFDEIRLAAANDLAVQRALAAALAVAARATTAGGPQRRQLREQHARLQAQLDRSETPAQERAALDDALATLLRTLNA